LSFSYVAISRLDMAAMFRPATTKVVCSRKATAPPSKYGVD
jgi:hypothetical protein